MRVPDRFRMIPWRRWLPTIMMVVGITLLIGVGHEYWAMYREQALLERQWEQENKVVSASEQPKIIDDGLTRVQIPKIDLDAIVVEGTTWKKLRLGPGRLVASALPGERGNSVITAHRDTFFRHIGDLQMNDEILVRRNGEVLKFHVTGRKIVQPTDLSVLKQTKEPTLTLITCYPTYYIGPAPERLIVTSKLVERAPNLETKQQASSTTP